MTASPTIPRHRIDAVIWARRIVADPFALVLDLETLGKEHDAGICDIAAVAMDGTVVFDQLIYPFAPIPAEATAVHGITDAMVAHAPAFREIYPDLSSLLSGRTVVTYNVVFDAGSIDAICAEYQLPALSADTWQCAMKWYARFVGERHRRRPGFVWRRLEVAAQELGLPPASYHRALADAEQTRRVIKAMAAAEP